MTDIADEKDDAGGGGEGMPSWLPGALPAEAAPEDDAMTAQAEEGDADAPLAADAAADAEADPEAAAEDDAALDAAAEEDAPEAAAAEGDEDAGPDAPSAAPDGEITIALEQKTRAADAEELVNQLRAVPPSSALVIDARAVEDISTPALAAIAAALRSREAMSPPAAVLAPTSAFVDAFSDLGLFQDLMKMEFRQ